MWNHNLEPINILILSPICMELAVIIHHPRKSTLYISKEYRLCYNYYIL